ncbi:MAG: Mth938-like domain-containing protein [Azospirillaceae bacterium]
MDITPLIPEGAQIVESYGGGGFRIAGQRYQGAVAVLPASVLGWSDAAIDEASLGALVTRILAEFQGLELLIIGTGETARLPGKTLRHDLRARGIGVEAMDTGAACRTFNVLLAEGRRVAAALIAV